MKILKKIMIFLLLAVLLTGCGGKASQENSEDTTLN